MPNYEQPQTSPGFPSSVTPVRTAEQFAEFDGCRIGVLLYPSTLDALLRTMLLVLSYSGTGVRLFNDAI